jgi:hypothetical protein
MIQLFRRADKSGLAAIEIRLDSCRTTGAVIEVLRSSIRALVDADGVTIVAREGDEVVYVTEDAISPLWAGQRFPLARCVSGCAFLNRSAVAISDIRTDPRVPLNAYLSTFVRSMAVVPIDERYAMGVYWREVRPVSSVTVAQLTDLAAAAAAAFARVRSGEIRAVA